MLQLFRQLVLLLAITAPGDVRCNVRFDRCQVFFTNPVYVETVTPANVNRIRALIEIKQDE